MSAVLVGLDLRAALASLPSRCDRMIARELLIIAEAGFISASIEREHREKDKPDGE